MEEYIEDGGLYVNNLPRVIMLSGTSSSRTNKIHRLTANLENLEYSGIFTTQGILWKFLNKKVV